MSQPSNQRSDQQLIAATLGGSREAFGYLVRRYQDRLYNGMVQITRNEAEAEDVVQEAFVLALRKLDTFQGRSQFFTWLYRIGYNAAITKIRRRKPTIPLDSADSQQRLQLPTSDTLPDRGMIEAERAEQLMKALDRMGEEYRAILVLREMDELDYSEIAEVLDLPIGTVRSRLHRARLQLKSLLIGMMEIQD